MARSVTFDVNQLIGALDVIQGTQIRYAGTQAMKRLGYELQQDTRELMSKTFNNPVPFTLQSPLYKAEGLSVRMFIYDKRVAKGQDPSRYLYPVSTEDTQGTKPAYITRFTRALQHNRIVPDKHFAQPWLSGRGVPVDGYGNVPAGFYGSVLSVLRRTPVGRNSLGRKNTIQEGWRVFSVPDARLPAGARPSNLKNPGIYRAKGRDLQLLFGYKLAQPTVKTTFDWRGHLTRRAEPLLSRLLSQEIDKALR